MRLIKLLIILGVLYLAYNAFLKEHFFMEQEDVISKMCKESHDFYKANEDMCKSKIGGECNVSSYAILNPDACRLLNVEPCQYIEYNEDHIDECKKYTNPNTNKPYDLCDHSDYLLNNKKDCRAKGYEPCSVKDYLIKNVEECRLFNYDICKLDERYLLNNADECRKYGVEACSNKEYRYSKVEDCMKLNFNPCNEKDFFSNPKAIMCGLGVDGIVNDSSSPCGNTEFLKNKGNLSQCCSKGKASIEVCKDSDISPCSNEVFLKNNSKECRDNGFEPCELSIDYKLSNSKECRDKGFEPCKVKDYLLNNMTECKALNYSPCVYQEYKDIHKDECEIK